eukprot:g13962.t1
MIPPSNFNAPTMQELQDCLAKGIAQQAARTGGAPSFQLSSWPMAGCPIAREFSAFARERCQAALVGSLNASHCPEHTMRPSILLRLCQQLDAFEIDASESLARISLTSEFAVRFRAPSGEALAILKMCSLVQVTLAAPAPLLALTRRLLKLEQLQLSIAQSFPLVGVGRSSRLARWWRQVVPGKSGSSRITEDVRKETSGDAPKLVRRSIDWNDVKFLEQLVRLGLKAGDEGWKKSWEELCEKREIAPTFSEQKPPKEEVSTAASTPAGEHEDVVVGGGPASSSRGGPKTVEVDLRGSTNVEPQKEKATMAAEAMATRDSCNVAQTPVLWRAWHLQHIITRLACALHSWRDDVTKDFALGTLLTLQFAPVWRIAGSLCTAAHSQSELRKPGEAVAEYREKHPQSGRVSKGAGKGREEALRTPPSRSLPQTGKLSR